MDYKALLMDEAQMRRSLARITHEIIEKNKGCESIMLIGVKRRGIHLAHILAENIKKFEGVDVPVGYVDISLYRDDLTEIDTLAKTSDCYFPESVSKRTVVIVDDVIYTGRTTRAAIEAVFANGRPKAIQLAVLIDRGHRELPIKPDYVGKNVPTSHDEIISVSVEELDGYFRVVLEDKAK
ncbi:MAG: bifunctional pyr operon transcriptional regulator/uracil phosphoribosyltransferase PyrR [Clostridia bacterium]|nr:bifunctional pyr operon transcriptional regulator/uracil phosphoribosyltransferase PyrR [Clostridia bacterium]